MYMKDEVGVMLTFPAINFSNDADFQYADNSKARGYCTVSHILTSFFNDLVIAVE